jgi:hypothetical protein
MPWIKRNLLFVIGLAVALALFGGGVAYLLSAKGDSEAASQELEARKAEYDGLVKRDPYPNAKNVEQARVEQTRVTQFNTNALKTFAFMPPAEALDDASFKALLVRVITDLEREADRRGVKLPTGSGAGSKYNFTFDTQRRELRLPPNTLYPLAVELGDVRDICQVLFASKIHSLVSIKRPAVGTNETPGATDLLTKKVGTNTTVNAGIYPYEVQFQCFSAELADAIGRLAASSNAYLVKTLNVERGASEGGDSSAAAAPVIDPAAAGRMAMMMRYGIRPGMMPPPVAAPAPAAGAPSGKVGEIVLEQKPLKVTLGLEVVRLAAPPGTNAPAAGPRRGRQ